MHQDDIRLDLGSKDAETAGQVSDPLSCDRWTVSSVFRRLDGQAGDPLSCDRWTVSSVFRHLEDVERESAAADLVGTELIL